MIEGKFNNTGNLQINQGSFQLYGDSNNTGDFSVANNSLLQFSNGIHQLENNSSITGAGKVKFNADTNIAGTYNITGNTEISNGTTNFNSNSIIPILNLTGGTVTFNNNSTISQLNQSSGTITGDGSLTIETFNWSGGTLSGSGSTTINNQLNLNSSSTKSLNSRTLTNNGTGIWTDTGDIYASNAAVFNNIGSLDIQSDADWERGSGDNPIFNNSGTLIKSGGNTESNDSSLIEGKFNNTGNLQINQGSFQLYGDSNNTGDFSVANNSLLQFSNGIHQLENNSSITGAGKVKFNADTNIAGTYNITGNTEISNGTTNFNSNSIIPILNLTGGTVTFNNNSTISQLNQSSGTITGDGSLTIETFNWSGGTLSGSGSTTINNQLNLNSSSTKSLNSRTLTNNGTGIWTDTGDIYASNAAVFNNIGSLDIQSDADWERGSGDNPIFNNSGTLIKSGGSTEGNGSSFIEGKFNNTGDLQINKGSFRLYGDSNNTGDFSVASDSLLQFSNGIHQLETNSSIAGAGNVKFNASNTNVAGTYNITGSTEISNGTTNFNSNSIIPILNLTGGTATLNSSTISQLNQSSGTLTGDGSLTIETFNWSGGTLSGSGNTTVNKQLNLNGSSTKYLNGRTLTNNLIGIWTDTGDIYASNAAVFNNIGSLDIQSDADFKSSSGEQSIFNNLGTLIKSGGSTEGNDYSFIEGKFNNAGNLQINKGSFQLYGDSNNTGDFSVASDSLLQFSNGIHQLETNSSIAGAGNVKFNADTNNIAGTYNITGSTEISKGTTKFNSNSTIPILNLTGGTVTFNNNSTISQLNQSRGTLTGDGSLTIETFNWSGGTLSGSGSTTVNNQLDLSGSSTKYLNSRTFTNNGTGIWTDTGGIYASNAAVFNNIGSLDIQSDVDFEWSSGEQPILENSGTLIKSGGSTEGNGSSFIEGKFNNTGDLQINKGSFRLYGGGNSSGNFNVNIGNSLEFSGGIHTLLTGYTVSGDGIVILSDDTLDVSSDGGASFNPGNFDNIGGTFIS
ncbi:hypothetical protein [Okeania sp. SIO3I5]|uniref:beta strand repeat-containing protein n=1 Tax=Okeania sp. SIO3I5 TaxID=2607805 RepID=UPI0025F2D16E|nr:hypothetical protein [Okeania sp. SIO3I5]